MKNIFIGIIATVVIFVGLSYTPVSVPVGGLASRDCDVTETTISVGHQLSTTVLSAKGRRAWAVIQQPINATNTVTVSFDGGTAAVDTQGYSLSINDGNSASTTDQVIFGLNTLFPYTGAVTAITASASSTLSIISCAY